MTLLYFANRHINVAHIIDIEAVPADDAREARVYITTTASSRNVICEYCVDNESAFDRADKIVNMLADYVL